MADQPISIHIVASDGHGERLDAWCAGRLPGLLTRNAVKKALKRGEITVDGVVEPSHRFLQEGQTVRQLEPSTPAPKVFPFDVPVVFEDDYVAVLHKPAGLRVNGPAWRTLENTLPHNLAPSALPQALRVPRVAHRLDLPTQGLVACAKTPEALVGLGWAFQRREVRKTYVALALGKLEGQGSEQPIDGRTASTTWEVLSHSRCLKCPEGWLTTVRLHPHTGRRHQLRRHLAQAGHPILGDTAYTPDDVPVLQGKGLHLAAVRLELAHPVTGEALDIRIDEPPKFASFRARETRRWHKHHPETP